MSEARDLSLPDRVAPEHPPRSRSVIRLDQVEKVYGGRRGQRVVANQDISLRVREGEMFGLLGPNGAGKTTLVLQILGLLKPTSGSIEVLGLAPSGASLASRSLVGYLPQGQFGMQGIDVERALRYTGALKGQTEVEASTQAEQLIEELELHRFRRRPVDKLSGGLIRIVNLGMTLMGNPRLLVLDEPTSNLDPERRRIVWSAIRRRNREEAVTCLLVTHNVLEAEQIVDRVGVLVNGRLDLCGTPASLASSVEQQTRIQVTMGRAAARDLGELQPYLQAREPADEEDAERVRLLVDDAVVSEVATELLSKVASGGVRQLRVASTSLEDIYLDSVAKAREKVRSSPRAISERDVPAGADGSDGRFPDLRGRSPGFLTAVRYLWLEQFFEIKGTWLWNLLFALLMPSAMVFGFARIGKGLTDPESLTYIISGASVFAAASVGVVFLGQRIGIMRESGTLTYYATLPVSRMALALAVLGSRLPVLLPGVVTPIVLAQLLYDIDIVLSAWLLLIIPLVALSLAAVGLTIGSMIRDLNVIMVVTDLLIFVLLLASPVMIPLESLPEPLRTVGMLLPPSFAADALRRALVGDLGSAFFVDVAALSAFCLIGTVAMTRAGNWDLR